MSPIPYTLSFTAGGLLALESLTVVDVYQQFHDWAVTLEKVKTQNLLQSRTASTSERKLREIRLRLQTLTSEQLALLSRGSRTEQNAVLWIAICKRYQFVRDFAKQVLREKYLSLEYVIEECDFDNFFESQIVWHSELERLAPSTCTKLRTVTLRMLKEAELTTADGFIQPTLFSPELAAVIHHDDPELFQIFPISPTDIPEPIR